MISQTEIELRIAEHEERAARVNLTGWQRRGAGPGRRPLFAMAALLLALAARLDPAHAQTAPSPRTRGTEHYASRGGT
jgi:hypothetical protein